MKPSCQKNPFEMSKKEKWIILLNLKSRPIELPSTQFCDLPQQISRIILPLPPEDFIQQDSESETKETTFAIDKINEKQMIFAEFVRGVFAKKTSDWFADI